jgi:CheY-like chemotaxis protein
MGEHIELGVKLDDADPVISADAGQLEQVVMNLATNARDAMPNGGSFTMATEVAEIDAQFIALHGYGISGKYAVMTASDTGAGIDGKTLPRIFEPFFTTKETGKGTGLGLSMVYGIIKAQNGYINCYSEPGKGTTFKIYLPLSPAEAREPDVPDSRPPRGGGETILVAEDSAEVRKLTTTILTDFGYKVIEAVDGEEAVRKFKENRDAVNLLLLDVIMPRKNGKDACDEIRAMRPDLKVIFISGYTADIISDRGFLDKGLVLLAKPLAPRTLLEKIREVLDG